MKQVQEVPRLSFTLGMCVVQLYVLCTAKSPYSGLQGWRRTHETPEGAFRQLYSVLYDLQMFQAIAEVLKV